MFIMSIYTAPKCIALVLPIRENRACAPALCLSSAHSSAWTGENGWEQKRKHCEEEI